MKSILSALLCAFIANAASAASLSFNVSGGANTGDAVTIDIFAEIMVGDGALPNRPILGLELRLDAEGGIEWSGAMQTLLTSFSGGVTWTLFEPICSGGDPCVAVNQSNPNIVTGFPPDPFSGFLATATGIAGPAGTYTIQLATVGEDFFGATNPPDALFVVAPEPSTAALATFGLLVLAAGRRVVERT